MFLPPPDRLKGSRIFRPWLERLESRSLPAPIAWVCDDGDWATPTCWDLGRLPAAGDDAVIDRPGNITVTHSTGDTSIRSLTSQEAFILSGGVLQLAAESVIHSSLHHSAGTLTGLGNVTVHGLFTFTGGRHGNTFMGFPVPLTYAEGGLVLGSDGSKQMIGRKIYNRAHGVTDGTVDIAMAGAAEIINTANAEFRTMPGSPLRLNGLTSVARGFTNLGFLHNRGGLSGDRVGLGIGGYAELDGAGIGAGGGATIGAGGIIHLSRASISGIGGQAATGIIWGEGNVLSISADMAVIRGTIAVSGNISFGSGPVEIHSNVFVAGGRITVPSSPGTNPIRVFGQVSAGSVLINRSGFIVSGGLYSAGDVEVTGAAAVTVNAGGWIHAGGVYRQTGMANAVTTLAGGYLHAAGGTSLERGTLTGSGVIDGPLWNFGQVRVGTPQATGTLFVNGPYWQDAGALLAVKLAGTDLGRFDRLVVSQDAELKGTLAVSLMGGFNPPAGSAFAVLQAGELRGKFATLNLPPLQGSRWDPIYTTYGLTLQTLDPSRGFGASPYSSFSTHCEDHNATRETRGLRAEGNPVNYTSEPNGGLSPSTRAEDQATAVSTEVVRLHGLPDGSLSLITALIGWGLFASTQGRLVVP